jgi:hypothetical protein
MRQQHVPGPVLFTPEDLADARRLLAVALPVVYNAFDVGSSAASKVSALVQADADRFGASVVAEQRSTSDARVATISQLAEDAHISRAGFYRAQLDLDLELCAVALVTLLALRGDFSRTAWRVCELESPVGRDATGGGIIERGRQRRQKLLGVSLAGGDVDIPTILTPEPTELDQRGLSSTLEHMLRRLQVVVRRLITYANHGDQSLLSALGVHGDPLLSIPRVFLMPAVHVGASTSAGWESTLYGGLAAARHAYTHGFPVAVVEAEGGDAPFTGGSQGWMQVAPGTLRQLAALGAGVNLDTPLRPSLVTYWTRRASESEGMLYRRQHLSSAHDDFDHPALAGELAYSVAGLDLDSRNHLATAVAYAEFLARGRGVAFAQQFGDQFTPSLVKGRDESARAIFRSLRIMLNAALVSVARRRQAELLTGVGSEPG